MQRFFIDTDDGHMALADEDGHEMIDARAACDLAIRALSDMTRDSLTASDRREFSCRVRSGDGTTLYSAALILTGEWQVDPSAG